MKGPFNFPKGWNYKERCRKEKKNLKQTKCN